MTPRLKGWPRAMLREYLAVVGRWSSRKRSAEASHQDSATRIRGWMVLLLLGGVAAYCLAEEITLTTYYPSPRGVYDELRTAGNVQIGLLDPPALGLPGAPRLHLVQGAGVSGDVTPAALRVDDEAPVGTLLDATPFLIDAAGNVGIGTASPVSLLSVVESGTSSKMPNFTRYMDGPAGAALNLEKARGTGSLPSAVVAGDVLGSLFFKGYDGSGFANGARIQAVAVDNFAPGAHGSALTFSTALSATGGLVERVRITDSGKVGIGTANQGLAKTYIWNNGSSTGLYIGNGTPSNLGAA